MTNMLKQLTKGPLEKMRTSNLQLWAVVPKKFRKIITIELQSFKNSFSAACLTFLFYSQRISWGLEKPRDLFKTPVNSWQCKFKVGGCLSTPWGKCNRIYQLSKDSSPRCLLCVAAVQACPPSTHLPSPVRIAVLNAKKCHLTQHQ